MEGRRRYGGVERQYIPQGLCSRARANWTEVRERGCIARGGAHSCVLRKEKSKKKRREFNYEHTVSGSMTIGSMLRRRVEKGRTSPRCRASSCLGDKLASNESVHSQAITRRKLLLPALISAAPCFARRQISIIITTNSSLQTATNISLLLRILDSTIADDICGFTFWAVRRIHDLRDSLIASTLSQQDASRGGMGEDMSTNRLTTISAGE